MNALFLVITVIRQRVLLHTEINTLNLIHLFPGKFRLFIQVYTVQIYTIKDHCYFHVV